jgi:hypothetical protein
VRELAIPRPEELRQADDSGWASRLDLGPIPDGQETRVLLRHGFRRWQDLYPGRQRVVMERLLSAVEKAVADHELQAVLEMAIVGAAEMAGLLSRSDRFYLKSYESMAGHRFNFTTFAAEPNVWGTTASGRGTVSRRLVLLAKRSAWLR